MKNCYLRKEEEGKPNPRDFKIPESQEEHDRLIEGMTAYRMWPSDAEANIKSRKMAFAKATKQHEKNKRDKQNPATMTTRAKKLAN